MISFDVVSLFTNVPLNEAINIINKILYDKYEINIPKQKTLNSKTYVQTDGVVMGSPLGPG